MSCSCCMNVGHNTFSVLDYELTMRWNGKSQAAGVKAWVCLKNFGIESCAGEVHELHPDL